MTERQALGIDIAQYARTGGTNFDRVRRFIQEGIYDFLIIKAGLGMQKNEIFSEQVSGAEQHEIPFSTYYFLDPLRDIEQQAQHYVDIVGTQQPQYIIDVEKPYPESRLPDKDELQCYIDKLVNLTGKKPIIYSRLNLLKSIGFLGSAKAYHLWIAQYLWDMKTVKPKRRLYRRFDEFTRDHEWELPPAVIGTGFENNVVLWQFSKKGKGQHYIFNPTTNHPKYKNGKESADLNISIAKAEAFMAFMFAGAPVIIDNDIVENGSPYPGKTNQDIINVFHQAAGSFSVHFWDDWIKPAGLAYMAEPDTNRTKPYTGPRIEDLPNLSDEAKAAIILELNNG